MKDEEKHRKGYDKNLKVDVKLKKFVSNPNTLEKASAQLAVESSFSAFPAESDLVS